MRPCLSLIATCLALPLWAAEVPVPPGAGTLAAAISAVSPGDVLLLSDGAYEGPVTIDRPLVVTGPRTAVIDGLGQGTVVTVTAVSAGWLLSTAGEVIALVPNTLGRALLHHEEVLK